MKVMDGARMTVNKEVVKQLAQSDMNFNFLLRYKVGLRLLYFIFIIMKRHTHRVFINSYIGVGNNFRTPSPPKKKKINFFFKN